MHTQELQDPEKVWTTCIKNQNSIENKMSNIKSSMIDIKPKDANKLDILKLEKAYPK